MVGNEGRLIKLSDGIRYPGVTSPSCSYGRVRLKATQRDASQ